MIGDRDTDMEFAANWGAGPEDKVERRCTRDWPPLPGAYSSSRDARSESKPGNRHTSLWICRARVQAPATRHRFSITCSKRSRRGGFVARSPMPRRLHSTRSYVEDCALALWSRHARGDGRTNTALALRDVLATWTRRRRKLRVGTLYGQALTSFGRRFRARRAPRRVADRAGPACFFRSSRKPWAQRGHIRVAARTSTPHGRVLASRSGRSSFRHSARGRDCRNHQGHPVSQRQCNRANARWATIASLQFACNGSTPLGGVRDADRIRAAAT